MDQLDDAEALLLRDPSGNFDYLVLYPRRNMGSLAPPPMIPHPQWSTDPPTGPGPVMHLLTEVTTASVFNSISCKSVEKSPPEDPDQSYRMIEMQEYMERQCMKQRREYYRDLIISHERKADEAASSGNRARSSPHQNQNLERPRQHFLSPVPFQHGHSTW